MSDKAPHHRKLWLWRNFVDGIPEYWAFGNAYPCRLGGGDPLVLGEPCGYALHIESSVGRDYDDDEVLAQIMRTNAYHFDDELGRLRAELTAANARIAELEALLGEAEAAQQRWFDTAQSLGDELLAAQSTIAELTATVERMREAIILHVADLQLTADRVSRFPGFEKTVDQFRLAVTELRAALGEP